MRLHTLHLLIEQGYSILTLSNLKAIPSVAPILGEVLAMELIPPKGVDTPTPVE